MHRRHAADTLAVQYDVLRVRVVARPQCLPRRLDVRAEVLLRRPATAHAVPRVVVAATYRTTLTYTQHKSIAQVRKGRKLCAMSAEMAVRLRNCAVAVRERPGRRRGWADSLAVRRRQHIRPTSNYRTGSDSPHHRSRITSSRRKNWTRPLSKSWPVHVPLKCIFLLGDMGPI